VSIDEERHAEGVSQHDVRGLAAHARQFDGSSIARGTSASWCATSARAMPTSARDFMRKNPWPDLRLKILRLDGGDLRVG
jgi:hypothetical protein